MSEHPAPSTPEPEAATGVPAAGASARKRWILLALLLVIAVGLWLAFRPGPDQVQGMADADSIHMAAKITARVQKLHVGEGDRVRAGQLLFELDSPEVVAKQRQAQAVLDAASAQKSKALEGARSEEIRATQANWNRAVAASDIAQSTATRLDTLFAEGVVTRQRRDEALAQAASAAAVQRAARAQYDEALAGLRKQDQEAAAAQVRQAEGAIAEVKASAVETRAFAPLEAEVEKRLAEVGELVPAGYPVFTLVDIDHLWVALNLREDQFAGVHVGQVVHGDIPALGIEDVPFRIYYISPAGDYATWRATRQSRGYDIKSFEVRARPVEPVQHFRPGMSVLFAWPPK
ncbi:MAG: efflux RND transporter periplasmic adaptor subunit [Pseudoxanthomonas sp.]